MSHNLLLVSPDTAVVSEFETIVRFLGYELTVVAGTRELYALPAGSPHALAVLNLDTSRDMREAINYFDGADSNIPLFALPVAGGLSSTRSATATCWAPCGIRWLQTTAPAAPRAGPAS